MVVELLRVFSPCQIGSDSVCVRRFVDDEGIVQRCSCSCHGELEECAPTTPPAPAACGKCGGALLRVAGADGPECLACGWTPPLDPARAAVLRDEVNGVGDRRQRRRRPSHSGGFL